MTIPSNIPSKVYYIGNDTTNDFNFPFRIEDIGDLQISITEDVTGAEEIFDGGVSPRFDATWLLFPLLGGSVELLPYTPGIGELDYLDVNGFLKTGYTIFIYYKADARQPTQYRNTSNMTPVNVEKGLDRLTMAVKAAIELGKQALRLQNGEGGNPVFPPLVGNENKIIQVNNDATGFSYGPTVNQIQGMVDAAEAAQLAAEAAATSAGNSEVAAATSATEAEGFRNESETFRDETLVYRNEAEAFRDEAEIEAALNNYSTVVELTFANSPFNVIAGYNGTLFKVDTSGGPFVFNMPAMSSVTPFFKIAAVKTTPDANAVTVNRNGADTINGSTSYNVDTEDFGWVIRSQFPGTNWEAKTFVNTSATPIGGAAGYEIEASPQSLPAASQITLLPFTQQVVKVVGFPADVTLSNTPFDSIPAHGTIIVIKGSDSSKVVEIPTADVDYGIIMPVNFYATKDASITLFADMIAKRFYQTARTDMP